MEKARAVFWKTLGGLSAQYYFRQFFFGLLFGGFVYFTATRNQPIALPMIFIITVNTLFYPYSRFVYERIVDFITGDTVFFSSVLFMAFVTFFTVMLCWCFAVFIAPVGLIYLYFYHSKQAKLATSDIEPD